MGVLWDMINITLPNFKWFLQQVDGEYLTNTFTGSLGTDSKEGAINKTTFNYKVFVKIMKGKGPVSFCAECFWRLPWNENCRIEGFAKKEFAVSQKGIDRAQKWLENSYLAGVTRKT